MVWRLCAALWAILGDWVLAGKNSWRAYAGGRLLLGRAAALCYDAAMTIAAITFDFWDTLAADDSDEPKRAALGLPAKAQAR